MENIALIGIDLGKNSFHIHCQDRRGKAVYRKKFTRPKLIEFLATYLMEACAVLTGTQVGRVGAFPKADITTICTVRFAINVAQLCLTVCEATLCRSCLFN
jgi:transposase